MTGAALQSVLEALADGRDVDASALQQLRDADPASADAVEQVVDRFVRLRRRDAQFAAVVAMTHDLVARRGGSLLESIAERAHELLGSDMTYISVYDGGTERFTVKAVRGETDPDFRGMVVPRGVGIATRVVQKKGPVWVDDYQSSHGFPHDDEIDRIVGAEQIRSILGVPLIADGHVLGVLFVADRRPRRYAPDEIGLARSFADHAAIVIEQGRLVTDLHIASTRAEVQRERAEATASEIRAAASLHEELTTLVASGSDPQTIAAALTTSLDRAIAVVDADLELLAGSAELLAGDAVRHDAVEAIAAGESARPEQGPVEFIAPIVVRQTPVGAVLVARADAELTHAGRRAVERSGIAFALMWMQRRASDLAEEGIRGEIVQELVDGRGPREPMIERVRARGLQPGAVWRAVHAAAPVGDAERTLRTLRASGAVLAAVTGGQLWALSTASDLVQRVQTALRRADAQPPLLVHAQAPSLAQLLDRVESIRGTNRFLTAMGHHAGAVDAEEFAHYTVLFDGAGERARAFVDAALGPVLDWDSRRGTELFETLLASLDEQGSVTGIARRLSVHPNTVRQRLGRIGALLPGDAQLPEARFRLEIAARLEAAGRSIAP